MVVAVAVAAAAIAATMVVVRFFCPYEGGQRTCTDPPTNPTYPPTHTQTHLLLPDRCDRRGRALGLRNLVEHRRPRVLAFGDLVHHALAILLQSLVGGGLFHVLEARLVACELALVGDGQVGNGPEAGGGR